MNTCEIVRTVNLNGYTIQFGVDVDRCADLETAAICANDIEDAICGMSLPEDDDDEDPVELGLRIGTMFAVVSSVEVFDQNGDGVRLRRG